MLIGVSRFSSPSFFIRPLPPPSPLIAMAAKPITILKRPTTASTPEDDEEAFTLVTRRKPKREQKGEDEDEVRGRADVKRRGPYFRYPSIVRIKELAKSAMGRGRYRDDFGRVWVEYVGMTANEAEAQFANDILSQHPAGTYFYWIYKKKDNSYASVHPEIDLEGLALTSLAIGSHPVKDVKHVIVLANGAAENKAGSYVRKVSYAVVAVKKTQ
jgi:hypothetical protein